MSAPTNTTAKTTTRGISAKGAARVSRLRALALAERERLRNGWSFIGARVTQRCPCCPTTISAAAPEPPEDPAGFDDYERQVNNLLNDAVLDHLHHECQTADQGRRP